MANCTLVLLQVIGVIEVRDQKDRGGFGEGEHNVLKGFCGLASVALLNSKRYEDMMNSSEMQSSDHSAARYLKEQRGFNCAAAPLMFA